MIKVCEDCGTEFELAEGGTENTDNGNCYCEICTQAAARMEGNV